MDVLVFLQQRSPLSRCRVSAARGRSQYSNWTVVGCMVILGCRVRFDRSAVTVPVEFVACIGAIQWNTSV